MRICPPPSRPNSNITWSIKVNNNRLLKKYTKIWRKISSLMNIEFDSEPVYGDNDEYIKAKIKLYGDKVNTHFQGKKIPKENASYKCLSLIMLDSVIRVSKKFYPQECKHEIKKTKTENLINDNLESSSSDDEIDSESANKTDISSDSESND